VGLHALAAIGGADSLATVKAALADKDKGVQDEAVRTLSTWPNKWPDDAAVMEPLQSLLKSENKTHKILALRGVLEYLQGAKIAPDAKFKALSDVLPAIERVEEKRLAISVLRSVPAKGALGALVAYADEKPLAEEASAAIVNLIGQPGGLKAESKDAKRAALMKAMEKARSGRTKRDAGQLLNRLK